MHQYTYLDYNFKTNELNQYPYISFFIILLFIHPIVQQISKMKSLFTPFDVISTRTNKYSGLTKTSTALPRLSSKRTIL
ncbi:hypothetical protein GQF20_02680 [Neisseria meningitidis]|nr:hypothetical protein [Neisseria meningitidis]MVZ68165.1 hypothetical protein [Neisseria meningitidis]